MKLSLKEGMILFMLLLLLLLLLLIEVSTIISTMTSNDHVTVAISMTSIPSRFNHMTECLLSWINQDVQPNYIFIFIPKQYKRFKRKQEYHDDDGNLVVTFSRKLISILNSSIELHEYIINNMINVIEIDKDWGPITKVIGMLQYNNDWLKYDYRKQPDYWIIGDDDVRYLKNTVSDYLLSTVSMSKLDLKMNVITHFPYDNRVNININDHDISLSHIQGVDTVLFPTILLLDQCQNGYTLCYEKFMKLSRYFHNKCNDSYYQDDYIISFAIGLGNVKVISIWGNDNVAKHINGVSKSNMQMHMNKKVFIREIITKECVQMDANDAMESIKINKKYDL